jgi:threonine aldolase
MRKAMAGAVVGNASWGEDPTVLALEEASAAVVGKEAGLFVPSGTMGNQVAIRVHTAQRVAPEIICEREAHIYMNEAAAIATISHAQVKTVQGNRGAMPPNLVQAALEPAGNLKPETALICVENTHNYSGGSAVPLSNLREIASIGAQRQVPIHLDGARIFNAAVALRVSPKEIAEHAETVQFCFSKALGAPVGSVLCGPREFIGRAQKVRQYMGGALRQAGVLAAPALVGLSEWERVIPEDHRRARRLAEGLAKAGWPVNPAHVDSNILVLDVADRGGAHATAARFLEHDVGVSVVDANRIRFVTHRDIDDAGIEAALAAARAIPGP